MEPIVIDGGAIHFLEAEGNVLIVSLIWVPAERRGLGIGGRLIKEAKKLGRTLMLTAEPNACRVKPKTRAWLIAWYQHHGFELHSAGFLVWRPHQDAQPKPGAG